MPDKSKYDFDLQPMPSLMRSLWTCSSLSLRLRLREKAQLVSKLFANVVMGLFYGLLFYQLSTDQWYMKAVLLFQVPSFILSSSFPQVQTVAKQKPIIIKHLDAAFYSSLVFTVSQFVVALPFILFDIAAFGGFPLPPYD
jgi:ABC-type multidrug transport system permease subunit